MSRGKCRKKVEGDHLLEGFLRAKMEANINKNSHSICNLLFLAFWNIFFCDFHVFESQLVKTCIIFSFLFCIDFLLIFCWFQIPRNLKNRAPVQAGALFLQNRCFRFESKNRSKNHRNLGSKIHENLNITFANLKWKCYIFEAKKPSKWGQKSLKIRSGQVS